MKEYQPITPLVSPFKAPTVFPTAGVHPRVYLTPARLPRVKAALTHPEHLPYYERCKALAATAIEKEAEVFEFDARTLNVIECKALLALLSDGDELAREAVEDILSVLRRLHITPRMDVCRAYGAVMHTVACVYDWCFPQLTEAEREELVSRCEYELGPNFEVGFPPEKQGMVTGHGSEAQMFRDWLSLGIATYDEYPDIYGYVAGRIQQQAIAPRDFYFRSGSHWQGSAYGPSRYRHDLECAILFHAMTDGEYHIFDPVMQETAVTCLCNLRADGEPFRDGDDWADRGKSYELGGYRANAFLASALYRDPMLRDYAFSLPDGIPILPQYVLLLDDPEVGRLDFTANLPRVRYCGSPRGSYVAHHPSGASVSFKVGEAYSANHEHKDSGHFMIYYKGSLASAANCYQYVSASGEKHFYGSALDLRYNKQTVAHNCMLVFDPDEAVAGRWGNSGGQKADDLTNGENADMETWLAKPTLHWARVLAHADATDGAGNPAFCMLSGDHTNAYSDKVKDYRRTSLAVGKADLDRPLLVFVYDRLETRDPAAEKTWQMHTMGKYELDGNRAITRHGDGGCLVLDSLLPERAVLSVIGSAEERFVLGGENLASINDPIEHPVREDGRGRLTVSPSEPRECELFLSAMYVTDDGKSTEAKAELLCGEGYVAASLLGTVALFPTGKEALDSLTVELGDGATLYATGLTPGLWGDGERTYRVGEEGRMLVAYGKGCVTLSRICD